MVDGNGLAEKLLGLDGFRVLEVAETADELTVTVETTATVVGCSRCGIRAESHDRRPVEVRDLACFGRPVRLRVLKRRWRCVEEDCAAKTWTETHPALPSRQVMTHRAGFEAARQVGELARPVSRVADEFGVCWDTVMAAVVAHGTPLVDDPNRVGEVTQLGVDETSFLKANRSHPTIYATGLVDTQAGVLIDMVRGNSAADLREWCADQPAEWLGGIGTVSIDLTDSYRSGLSPHLDHVLRVADPFHGAPRGARTPRRPGCLPLVITVAGRSWGPSWRRTCAVWDEAPRQRTARSAPSDGCGGLARGEGIGIRIGCEVP